MRQKCVFEEKHNENEKKQEEFFELETEYVDYDGYYIYPVHYTDEAKAIINKLNDKDAIAVFKKWCKISGCKEACEVYNWLLEEREEGEDVEDTMLGMESIGTMVETSGFTRFKNKEGNTRIAPNPLYPNPSSIRDNVKYVMWRTFNTKEELKSAKLEDKEWHHINLKELSTEDRDLFLDRMLPVIMHVENPPYVKVLYFDDLHSDGERTLWKSNEIELIHPSLKYLTQYQ